MYERVFKVYVELPKSKFKTKQESRGHYMYIMEHNLKLILTLLLLNQPGPVSVIVLIL